MAYFNFHANVKKLINGGNLLDYKFVNKYNNISPALVLYFKNHRPIPIRQHMWGEYIEIILVNTKELYDE